VTGRPSSTARDRRTAAAVERWFATNRREFAWRTADARGRRDPYHALVAETMAQQTQIARVSERFAGFTARFPTLEALARASEAEVLAAWAGLGYYRRAKNLHGAAKAVAALGRFPETTAELLELPGVGPYTAGALASIVFGKPAAMVDGNVARVLVRLDLPPSAAAHGSAGRAARERWAWRRSEALVNAATDPGSFNEGLMELGATVCLPSPRGAMCGECPLAGMCRARRSKSQADVPPPKPRAKRATVWADALVVRDERGRVLLERRPSEGMWAGLWQVPTIESDDGPADGSTVARGAGVGRPRRVGEFEHTTSHRLVRFGVWTARPVRGRAPARGEWRPIEEAASLGMSSAQLRVLELAGGPPAARAGAPRGMLTA
jgi:A/G-specific adenine glycosylase